MIRFLALAPLPVAACRHAVPGVDIAAARGGSRHPRRRQPGSRQPAAGAAPAPTLADVAYGSHPRQVLDFWKARPRGPPRWCSTSTAADGCRFPKDKTVVVTHGLADYLAAGSPSSRSLPLVSDAQAAGVKPPVQWPMHDAARALQFVRAKAAEWGLDKARIGLFGGSRRRLHEPLAGAARRDAEPGSPDPVARESTRPSCVRGGRGADESRPGTDAPRIPNSVYGGHAFGFDGPWTADVFQRFYEGRDRVLPWIKEYSPIEWASAGDPPVFLQYDAPPAAAGQVEKDPTHSAVFGTKLQQRLREVGVECHLSYPGSPETKYRSRYEFLVDRLSK